MSGMARRQSTGRSQLRRVRETEDNNHDDNDSRPFAEESETRSNNSRPRDGPDREIVWHVASDVRSRGHPRSWAPRMRTPEMNRALSVFLSWRSDITKKADPDSRFVDETAAVQGYGGRETAAHRPLARVVSEVKS